jgi:hypothetical protein
MFKLLRCTLAAPWISFSDLSAKLFPGMWLLTILVWGSWFLINWKDESLICECTSTSLGDMRGVTLIEKLDQTILILSWNLFRYEIHKVPQKSQKLEGVIGGGNVFWNQLTANRKIVYWIDAQRWHSSCVRYSGVDEFLSLLNFY